MAFFTISLRELNVIGVLRIMKMKMSWNSTNSEQCLLRSNVILKIIGFVFLMMMLLSIFV
ncbi:hypothetical protein A9X05_09055 [Mycobacterium sp. E3298]|nr:hypothetical protein A9X05_09055 [Mycobacterium sp. E3298]